MVRLDTLGRVEAFHTDPDGRTIGVIPIEPKRMALLAYLTVEGGHGRITRDSAIGLFWPEHPETAARSALRQALHYLNRRLGGAAVLGGGRSQVGIDPAVVDCDAVRFERAVGANSAADTLASYVGDFLPGFYYSAMSSAFEDWMMDRRRWMEDRALKAALRLSESEIERGDWIEGARWLRQALEFAPFDESVLRRLLVALGRSENRAGAAYEFSFFVTRLRAELGRDVSPRTSALADAITLGLEAKWSELERVRELRERLARETLRTRELVRQAQELVQGHGVAP